MIGSNANSRGHLRCHMFATIATNPATGSSIVLYLLDRKIRFRRAMVLKRDRASSELSKRVQNREILEDVVDLKVMPLRLLQRILSLVDSRLYLMVRHLRFLQIRSLTATMRVLSYRHLSLTNGHGNVNRV